MPLCSTTEFCDMIEEFVLTVLKFQYVMPPTNCPMMTDDSDQKIPAGAACPRIGIPRMILSETGLLFPEPTSLKFSGWPGTLQFRTPEAPYRNRYGPITQRPPVVV